MNASVREVPTSRDGDKAYREGGKGLKFAGHFDVSEQRESEYDTGENVARDGGYMESACDPSPCTSGDQHDP